MINNKLSTEDTAIRKRFLQTCDIKDDSIEEIIPKIFNFKETLLRHKSLIDLFENKDLNEELLICAGASRKSLEYFTSDDKKELLEKLYQKYRYMNYNEALECILYRYIVQKGDSFAGAIRNKIGFHGKDQIIEKIVNIFDELKITYHWFNPKLSDRWIYSNDSYYSRNTILKRAQGFAWKVNDKYRMLLFNQNVPYLNKNVDIVLLGCTIKDFTYKHFNNKYIMMGEIKSGIDLKNSDEHWKTAWASLERINKYFEGINQFVKISFVAGAITDDVATEINEKIKNNQIHYAVNLTNESDLEKYCKWILSL